jgi:hypothetical protein
MIQTTAEAAVKPAQDTIHAWRASAPILASRTQTVMELAPIYVFATENTAAPAASAAICDSTPTTAGRAHLNCSEKELPMNNLTPDQQAMLVTWQQHTYAEFVLKDALKCDVVNQFVVRCRFSTCIPAEG